jgi:DNA replication protein DnaC
MERRYLMNKPVFKCDACNEETTVSLTTRMCKLCIHLGRLGMPYKYLESQRSLFGESMQKYFETTDSLYVHGKIGTGKTWFVSAIMREVVRATEERNEHDESYRGYSRDIRFTSVPEIMMMVKDSMNPRSEVTELQILDKYSKAKVLFLDDIGADHTTDYVRAFLYLLMERRDTGEGLRTVITSNLSLVDLAKIHGERISSRITGMCEIVKLSGKDRRNEKMQ